MNMITRNLNQLLLSFLFFGAATHSNYSDQRVAAFGAIGSSLDFKKDPLVPVGLGVCVLYALYTFSSNCLLTHRLFKTGKWASPDSIEAIGPIPAYVVYWYYWLFDTYGAVYKDDEDLRKQALFS